jgi:hypothetical protein
MSRWSAGSFTRAVAALVLPQAAPLHRQVDDLEDPRRRGVAIAGARVHLAHAAQRFAHADEAPEKQQEFRRISERDTSTWYAANISTRR